MRMMGGFGAACALMAMAATASAGDIESGLGVGDSIGAYQSVKCGGAEDGVEVSKQLCYT